MNKLELQEMAKLEAVHWWHVGRNEIIKSLLDLTKLKNVKICNFGSGTGGTLAIINQYGEVDNFDTSEDALSLLKEKHPDASSIQIDLKNPNFYEQYYQKYDLLVAFDVLEHIKDDQQAVENFSKMLKDKGTLIITVPAYMWLWTSHDEVLSHYRRYSISHLHAMLNQYEFKVVKRTYAISFSFPLVFMLRLVESLFGNKEKETSYFLPPKFINSFLTFLLNLEAKIIKKFNFPFGLSCVIIAVKK